jgi:hypothetical protein
VGQGEAWLLDESLEPLWRAALPGDAFHVLPAEAGFIRLAAMGADDWQEFVLDAGTGRPIASP